MNLVFVKPLDYTILAADSTDAAYPASNLVGLAVDPTRFDVLATAFVELQLDAPGAVDVVAPLFQNARASATVQVRAAINQANLTAAPVFDETFNSWASINIATAKRHGFHQLVDPGEEFWRFDFNDVGNPDGYYELSALVLGADMALERNFSFNAGRGADDDTKKHRVGNVDIPGDSGDIVPVKDFTLGWLTDAEALAMQRFMETIGRSKPYLAVLNPADQEGRAESMIYGLVEPATRISNRVTGRHRRKFIIRSAAPIN